MEKEQTTSSIAGELAPLRRDMFKFARLQLQDDAAAEDAVQEALAAALSGQKAFNNRAQHNIQPEHDMNINRTNINRPIRSMLVSCNQSYPTPAV